MLGLMFRVMLESGWEAQWSQMADWDECWFETLL